MGFQKVSSFKLTIHGIVLPLSLCVLFLIRNYPSPKEMLLDVREEACTTPSRMEVDEDLWAKVLLLFSGSPKSI